MWSRDGENLVQIKKYPNRRYYDATHSRHITLQEVHDLIVGGTNVCVTDSRTGDDITNLVLTQILLEQDEPKLDLFPSSILHMMVRSNRQVLRTWLDRSFGPLMGLLSQSQKQFDAYLRQAMPSGVVTPVDWANRMVQAFSGLQPPPSAPPEPPEAEKPPDDTVTELRRQVEELQRRMDALSGPDPGK